MATIAVHRESGVKYVVLGGSFRMFTPTHPITSEGQRKPSTASPKSVPIAMTMVADAEGAMIWFGSEELVVVEIDGSSPTALLTNAVYR